MECKRLKSCLSLDRTDHLPNPSEGAIRMCVSTEEGSKVGEGLIADRDGECSVRVGLEAASTFGGWNLLRGYTPYKGYFV